MDPVRRARLARLWLTRGSDRATFPLVNASRGVLASTLGLLLVIPGCDEEPECSVLAGISGDVQGQADWQQTGAEDCGFVDPKPIGLEGAALVIVRGDEQFVLVMNTPVPDVGSYTGSVIALLGGITWRSPVDGCGVIVSKFDLEGWSLRDFIRIQGTFECPDPLTTPGGGQLQLSTLAFDGFIYDEIQSQNI